MKKIIITILIIGVGVAVVLMARNSLNNNMSTQLQEDNIDIDKTVNDKQVFSMQRIGEQKPDEEFLDKNVAKDILAITSIETVNDVENQLRLFNLPDEIVDEIIVAINEGEEVVYEGDVLEEELHEANASPQDIKQLPLTHVTNSLVAGNQIDQQELASMINAAMPIEGDDALDKQLKSDALFNIGFAAQLNGNEDQTQEVFNVMMEHYGDADASIVAAFELAKLKANQGKLDEAANILNDLMLAQQGNADVANDIERFKTDVLHD